MFGPARQKKAAERQRRPHIAGSDWLIGKPNSSKLIGIINSTRAAERAREEDREGEEVRGMREERVAARKSEESKPGEETFKKSTRHSESERPALSVDHLNLS